MERAISEMEKIRRAEEIYSRRKNRTLSSSIDRDEKSKNISIYRVLFQFLALINIAVVVIAIQNKNYIFTEDFLKQADKYNINIKSKVNEIVTYLNKEVVYPENIVTNETDSIRDNQLEAQNEIQVINNENQEESSLSQMDIDVNFIKSKYTFICPVLGTKTSSFGTREANEIVTKYHTGVDIANGRGTVIKSSVSGRVTQVSSEGDYGNHLKIAVDDIVTLYAHCDKIYVKEGDEIKQGQDIAEIGSTGNSTGNHLHFEIRYQNRYIDPERLIEI